MKTPDVGTIVEYGSLRWKVTGWLHRVKGALQFCRPREATHVSLSGNILTIAPIKETKAVGVVEWEKRLYQAERGHALYLANQRMP